MSRYKGEFAGYAPGLTLSMREAPEGGPVVACVGKWGNEQTRSQNELLVLVHGFNNNQYEAQQAYSGFRDLQKELVNRGTGARLEDLLGDAFWPGDANWAGPLDWLDFLVYPATIAGAKDTADRLCAYLLQRRDLLELSFVGHSMGCRVVLETIARLKSDASFQIPIKKVCLMAAAVPTFAVCPGGTLEPAFSAAEEVKVLHSRDDNVLSYAFPAGQTLAGDGFLPQAVGLHGNVPRSGRVSVQSVDGAGHSDYWGWKNSMASAKAASFIGNFLNLETSERVIPAASAAPPVAAANRDRPAVREVGE
jgi:pimeloyl-ACP methyl ester carboxylesterase